MYLKYHPENQAVRKFCDFIASNKTECTFSDNLVLDMVDQEENYTDGSE